MDTENIIELAREILEPIKYVPEDVGYFVKQDDIDLGGEDYCIKCIKKAVKSEKKIYFEKLNEILNKYKKIENTGFYNGINVLEKYTNEQIEQSKKLELKDYPFKTKFSYEGHDPDFSGGNTEPITCAGCGKYFYTDFYPDLECANYLLLKFGKGRYIRQSLKWELSVAFCNYRYLENDVKNIILSIAEKIVKQKLCP